jgi:hypothetical protein
MSDTQLKRQLVDLVNSGTPPGTMTNPDGASESLMETLTVGDDFKALRDETATGVRSIPERQSIYKRMFVGTFGSGKTHMALSLYHELKLDNDQIIITFDFSRLNGEIDLFQYLLFKGFRTKDAHGYQAGCRYLYERICEQINLDAGDAVVDVAKATLYSLYKYFAQSAEGLVRGLGQMVDRHFGDELKAHLREGKLNDLIEKYKANTSHEFTKFVETLSDLAANPDATGDRFADEVRQLSQEMQGQFLLLDYFFKLCAFAGVKRIVIIADEFEALDAHDTSVEPILAMLRNFHDECRTGASNQVYPSIAMLFFSTDPFLANTVQFSEPGLWRRWEDDFVHLPEPKIEEVVPSILELAERAGYVDDPSALIDDVEEALRVEEREIIKKNRTVVIIDLIKAAFKVIQ